jgi:hypothetical protein
VQNSAKHRSILQGDEILTKSLVNVHLPLPIMAMASSTGDGG